MTHIDSHNVIITMNLTKYVMRFVAIWFVASGIKISMLAIKIFDTAYFVPMAVPISCRYLVSQCLPLNVAASLDHNQACKLKRQSGTISEN